MVGLIPRVLPSNARTFPAPAGAAVVHVPAPPPLPLFPARGVGQKSRFFWVLFFWVFCSTTLPTCVLTRSTWFWKHLRAFAAMSRECDLSPSHGAHAEAGRRARDKLAAALLLPNGVACPGPPGEPACAPSEVARARQTARLRECACRQNVSAAATPSPCRTRE